jgi:hypothetical protein
MSSHHHVEAYGNGVSIYDYYQTVPVGPLTEGYVRAQHYFNIRMSTKLMSFHITDTHFESGFPFRSSNRAEPSFYCSFGV